MENEKKIRRSKKAGQFSRLMSAINKIVKILTPPPLVMIIITTVFILANLTSLAIITPMDIKYDKNTKQVINDNSDLDTTNNRLLTQFDKMNSDYFGIVLIKSVPTDKLTEIAQKSWKYFITVNGKKFDATNTYDAKSSKIDILFTEQMSSSDIPVSVAVLGEVSRVDGLKSIENVITATATISKCTITKTSRNNQTIVDYSFTNVKAGEIITLILSNNLKKQLGLNTNMLEVFNSKIIK